MNKKFLSAILFGSLMVTSTGTFVSCKDYDDDIDELKESVNAQKSDLSTQVTALQTALNAAQAESAAAKNAADAAAQAAADAKASAIKEALAAVDALKQATTEEFATKTAEVAAQISAVDSELNKLTKNVDAHTEAVNTLKIQMEAVQAYKELIAAKADAKEVEALDEKIAAIEKTISSMATSDTVESINKKVEGISSQIGAINEALVTIKSKSLRSLVFVPSLYLDGVEAARYPYAPGLYLKANHTEGANGVASNEETYVISKESNWKYAASEDSYLLSPVDTVYYHLNPSYADLKNVAWSFGSTDAEFVSRAATKWTPKVSGTPVKHDGVVAVPYVIKNADKVSVDENLLSVMALNAKLANDSTVNSDYNAVLPAVQHLKAIAYNDDSILADDCANNNDELWANGKLAVENEPSISVAYNKGAINLDEYLNIHYTQKDFTAPSTDAEHKVMDYKTALEKYNLKFEYEMMPYILGEYNTSESSYGKLEGSYFYPCYVNADGTQVVCPADGSEVGKSAVGKMPVVLVKLVDQESKEVVLAGYIKLKIVKKISVVDFTIKSFELPLICGEQQSEITWAEASALIYEKTGYSKSEFIKSYTADAGLPYVKNAEGEFVKMESEKFGELLRNTDGGDLSTTNEIIRWEGNLDNLKYIAKQPNRSVTLYVKYTSNTDATDVIYVGMVIKVAEAPIANYGEKIAAYWYADITGTPNENVRNNVPRPTTAGIKNRDVLNYKKDLDDNFKGNVVKFELTAAAQNQLYKDGTYSLGENYAFTTEYTYQFAEEQPKVGEFQLARSANDKQALVTVVGENEVVVATLTDGGVVEYQNNETAKAILNSFSHSETTAAKMQYANVEIVATYGECAEPLGTYGFAVRFLRPVDILKGDKAFFEDAQANGSSVVLGDFIKLQDWRDMDLIQYNATAKKYVSAVENDCHLYDYYLFNNIKIDLANTESTLTGKREKLSEVTNKLSLKVDNGGTLSNAMATTVVSIGNIEALNNTKIVYFNNEGNVQEFELYIPIEITYSWGTLKGEIVAKVGKTKAN